MASIKNNTQNLKKNVIKIYEKYLDKLSTILIQYYNSLENLEFANNSSKDYTALEEDLINEMEDMLGEVYQEVSKFCNKTYGDNDYPISEIEFYNKDDQTIKDRLSRWFSPNSKEFINDKLIAIYNLSRILKSECRNTEEKTKHDKLWELCDYFDIGNEDNDFCEEYPDCQFYQGRHYKDENIPLPLYHPDCECYVEYYGKDLGLIGVEDYDELIEENRI